MANVNWDDLYNTLTADGKELLSILKPYLPALAREGQDVYDGFLKHLNDNNWEAVDKLMYAKMTIPERRQLEDQVYQDARTAAQAKYDRVQTLKDIGFKVALRVLMLVIAV